MAPWRDKVAQLLPPLRANPEEPSFERWQREGEFWRKDYDSYEEYQRHQSEKLDTIAETLKAYEARYCAALSERLRDAGRVRPGARVLCLGARLGGEVKVFHDLGCFAVGIDLNPGAGNRYVLAGDFHDLQFPDGSVDIVFTNSFDHALEPEKVLAEVKRVLTPGGLFITDAVAGRQEGNDPRGVYEVFTWERTGDLVQFVAAQGLEILDARDFGEPWVGRHLTFRKSA